MRLVTRLAVSFLALTAFGSPGYANFDAKILLHLASPTTKNPCTAPQALPSCLQVVTAGSLYPSTYFAYVLVADGDRIKGLAGLQFGIDYDGLENSGVDILGWNLCATLDFHNPDWPGDGSGNLITWDYVNRCQRTEPGGLGTGVVANAGYFYMAAYSPGDLRIVPRPVDGLAKVADCLAVEYIVPPSALGFASFSANGSAPGSNPCSGDPGQLMCAISGPPNVPKDATAQFTVEANVPGYTVSWSISGSGSIIGSSTEGNVAVQVGSSGSFLLTATVSAGGNTTQCAVSVGIVSCVICQISGPDYVYQGSTTGYAVTSFCSGITFAWSFAGNGTMTPPAGPGPFGQETVSVTAENSGSFTITVVASGNGFSATCLKTVTIVESASCFISGPSSVAAGSAGHIYLVETIPATEDHFWSITGNGVLTTSGALDAVRVTAGSVGSFVLTHTATTSAGTAVCEKTVTVSQGSSPMCSIAGPTQVMEGVSNIQFQGSSSTSGVSYNWSITGSGTITSSATASLVHVTAGPAGFFQLRMIVSSPSGSDTCEHFVNVNPTPTSEPGRNANAKILVHLVGPTTKNACTRTAALPACGQIVNEGNIGTYYYAHVLVTDGYTNGALLSGVAGVDFGIAYNNTLLSGVDIYSWHLCADNEIPASNWPESGGSNQVTWNASTRCQRLEPGGTGTGVVATPGYFYMGAYSPDVLAIIKPADAEARVHDCQGYPSTISPQNLGNAAFGGAPGYNPCADSVNLQTTTWGRIKALFRPEE